MNKYKCFKCSKDFEVEFSLDTDKPTCNECFEKLKKIKTGKEYMEFIT